MTSPNRQESGLNRVDFVQIAKHGFHDPENSYSHSMAFFRNRVYVGTSRDILGLLKLFPPPDGAAMDPWPVKVPESVEDLDLRAQIWCWDPTDAQWTKVYTSPLIVGRQGRNVPRDLGYRGMVVFQGDSDPAPALYVGTLSSVSRGDGARILRSLDGKHFEAVSEPGLGNPNVSTFRSMVAFDGHLAIAPAGEGSTWNTTEAPIILRCTDPTAGKWELACEPGFGDPTNGGIFELAATEDYLYAGTFNHVHGYQVWKAPATGGGPWRWTKCIGQGAYRGSLNEIAMSLCSFNEVIYVGGGIQNGGYDRWNFVGPAAGEVIRIYPDDTWDLVVGTPRDTPEGRKLPLSGRGPGFDNIFAGYQWRMVEHGGWLYASTFDWSAFLPYATKVRGPYKDILRRFGAEQIASEAGGFGLWRSHDGADWVCVTQNGMGNPYNFGARTLLSAPYGLFVGTANPFGPEVALKLGNRWTYTPNPSGGAEVWLGRTTTENNVEEVSGIQTQDQIQRDNNGSSMPLQEAGGRKTAAVKGQGKSSKPSSKAAKSGKDRPHVLLTGATGLIGSRVLDMLLHINHKVRVLALPETVKDIRQSDKVEVITGNLIAESELYKAVEGIVIVYHMAALLPGSSRVDLMRVNVHGTENLLRACVRMGGIRRFVFTSSVAVYGGAFNPQAWPITETSPLTPGGTINLRDYGRSKVAAESLVRRYCCDYGCEYVILRPSTIYGPGGSGPNNTAAMTQRVLSNPWAGEGRGSGVTVQMIHANDMAEAIVLAGTKLEAKNGIFNVAGSEVVTNRDLARLIRRLAGQTTEREFMPDVSRTWRQYLRVYDTTKAQKVLGFVPRVSLHDGLEEMVAAQLVS